MFGRLKNWLSGRRQPEAQRKVYCAEHGETDASFVCQHLIGGSTGRGFYTPDVESDTAMAWCGECDCVRERCGGWNDESEAFVSGKVVCAKCFEAIRQRNQVPENN
jgi:hypothetical protein